MYKFICLSVVLFCVVLAGSGSSSSSRSAESGEHGCPKHEIFTEHQGCDSCLARLAASSGMGGFGCATAPQKGCFCPEGFGRLEDNTCVRLSKCPRNPAHD